jgi:hypothetical protein
MTVGRAPTHGKAGRLYIPAVNFKKNTCARQSDPLNCPHLEVALPNTTSVRKVAQRRTRGVGGTRGQLDRFDDGTWEFYGNGETSTAQVAENIINYEKKEGNADYDDIKADMLAQLLLEDPINQSLHRAVNGDAKKPIPVTQSMLAEGDTLKKIVVQLMAHEKQLRQTLLLQSTQGHASDTDKTLGTVQGGGLSLPYEP